MATVPLPERYLVMELMQRSVSDVLTGGRPVGTGQVLGWLREAGSALDAAHEAGIVHRDIKPANMLLDRRERLALADFGIARLAYEDQLTATGTLLGTSSYISPEQALGEPATAASDRYALAVVAFQMLTGEKPFVADHFAAQARAHIEDPPPRASEREPGLDPAVDAVLQRGMAKDPHARWATSGELVGALERALGTPAAAATAVTAAETRAQPLPPAAERARAAPAPRSADAPDRRPRRWGPVVAAIALLLLVGVAAALILTAGDGPEDERAEPTPTATETAVPDEPTPEATPEATPEPTEAPTVEPPPTPTPEAEQPDPAAAAQLNNEGFALFPEERYEEAVAPLAQAYELCQGSSQLDPCGFATFNYGAALNRSGDPEAAIPILEERMARFGDNEGGDVARELRAARRAARSG